MKYQYPLLADANTLKTEKGRRFVQEKRMEDGMPAKETQVLFKIQIAKMQITTKNSLQVVHSFVKVFRIRMNGIWLALSVMVKDVHDLTSQEFIHESRCTLTG